MPNVQKAARRRAQFYAEAFTEDAKLAENLQAGHRYNAACSAALAGCGESLDADKLDAPARASLRRQALAWLRADLTQWTKQMENASPQFRTALQNTLEHWQQDADLAGLRGKKALTKLAAAEQPEWYQLWADVSTTLAKLRENNSRKDKGGNVK